MMRKHQIPSLIAAGGIIMAMLPWMDHILQQLDHPFPFFFVTLLFWMIAFSFDTFITYRNKDLLQNYETNLLLWKLGKIKQLSIFTLFPIAFILELSLILVLPYFFLHRFDLSRSGIVIMALCTLHVHAYLNNANFVKALKGR